MYEKEEFGRLLNRLQDLVDTRMNVVLTAHAMVRKFERPDQPPYDRYELKLNKAGAQKISDMVKEWADMLLFANYKEEVYKVDSKDGNSKKTKVVGGQRVMYTSHHPNWDAKNRHGLAECLPFEFAQIAHCIPNTIQAEPAGPAPTSTKPVEPPTSVPESDTGRTVSGIACRVCCIRYGGGYTKAFAGFVRPDEARTDYGRRNPKGCRIAGIFPGRYAD